ncbi:MAG: radical SAM protein [bacterium]|nr:radical SAM protein [bacterium]
MKKKVYLIQPTYRNNEGRLLKGRKISLHALAVPALSSTIPPDWEKEFCLEYFEDVNYDTHASVVAITTMGYDIMHGREIAAEFKKRGKTVLFGGYQAHFSENLLRSVADSVVHGNPGPADMATILGHAEAGRLAPRYECGIDIDFPFDYSVLQGKKAHFMPVLASVGCVNRCEFCCTGAVYKGKHVVRDLSHVMADLHAVRGMSRNACFVDSNIYNNRPYLLELCSRIIEENLGLTWGAQSTVVIADDAEALSMLRRAGCRILFIGLETLNQDNLKLMHKGYAVQRYREQIRRIREAGILVGGFFMLGLDGDDVSSFGRLFDFIHESRISLPILNLLLPAPGTKVFDRLKTEGRLLIENEEDYLRNNQTYNTACNRCFYLPKRMSPAEAEAGFLKLGNRLCSFREIVRRSTTPNPLTAASIFFMNMDLRAKFRAMASAQRAISRSN